MPSSPFCESRARHMMDLLHVVRYDGFSALPSTEHLVHQSSYVYIVMCGGTVIIGG